MKQKIMRFEKTIHIINFQNHYLTTCTPIGTEMQNKTEKERQ